MQEVRDTIQAAVKDLFNVEVEPALTRPDEQFGDYATNVALQLAKQLNKNPREIADQLAKEIKSPSITKTEVAGPGFVNITLTDEYLAKQAFDQKITQSLKDQEILVEFGDPNPFKEMHIGHLYSYIVGDSICRLLETNGAKVRRSSYHGDVGLHVAKAIFGLRELKKERDGRNVSLDSIPTDEIDEFLKTAYAYGAKKYEENDAARTEIEVINKHIYLKDDPAIDELHRVGCKLSFSYFDSVLSLLGISNDKRYLESQTTDAGKKLVEQNLGPVFEESQGAIVYEGEKKGLHTRVFITSKGLPTYEAKDLGLTVLKDKDYPKATRSIIITAHEQSEYFKVMLAALSEIDKPLADKTTHLAHGFLSLSTGKMSSRTGDVYGAMELLLRVKDVVHEQYPDSPVKKEVTLAAVKYTFLKHKLGSDIVVDIKESVSLEGNSGPYLQYAHARARSILAKSSLQGAILNQEAILKGGERSLVRKIGEYPEVVGKAVSELMPHYICTYLYELAQTFNRFYENNRVIDDPREAFRLQLVEAYAQTLKNGLSILNISAPEKM